MQLKPSSLMNLMLMLSRLINIQGREANVGGFVKKKMKKNVGLHSDIYRPISFTRHVRKGST